jgi:hypothetical protein
MYPGSGVPVPRYSSDFHRRMSENIHEGHFALFEVRRS